MQSKTILVVDDDPNIREVICFALQKASYRHEVAIDGKEAMDKAALHSPALIILDIGLPEMDGLDVCREIRKRSEVPILFLSARDDEIDRIIGLELGADDYVTKPFSQLEQIARGGDILNRYDATHTDQEHEHPQLRHGLLVLEKEARQVRVKDAEIGLTAIEFEILSALMDRPKIVYTRERILEKAYKDNIHVSDRTIDSHIRYIRAKLASAGCGDAIETVHGVGIRLGACEKTS